MFIRDFRTEFARYRAIGEKAIEQVTDAGLNEVIAKDGNSIGMLVRHISGNFKSRFTDFLTSDGEKPERDRDSEFNCEQYSRSDIEAMWRTGWEVVEPQLESLKDLDLTRSVTIRGVPLTVHEALCRSVSHTAYHVGQIVLTARVLTTSEWRWISIPKGQSEKYNQNPTAEKGFK